MLIPSVIINGELRPLRIFTGRINIVLYLQPGPFSYPSKERAGPSALGACIDNLHIIWNVPGFQSLLYGCV